MKICKKCRGEFAIEDFPPYSANGKTGRRGVCRKCWNEKWSPIVLRHQNRYYHENRNGLADRAKARALKRYRDDPQSQLTRSRAYEERYPERKGARSAVLKAIRSGRLKREPCRICGNPIAHAHHEDYSKQLDVMWLCRKHHGERHRELNRRGK